MSYERVIRVLLFQTAVNVAYHGYNISSAQEMNHSIQDCFLELKLKQRTTKEKCNYRKKKIIIFISPLARNTTEH